MVTPPTTVVTTGVCCDTVTVPDLWTVMMGRLGVPGVETTETPPTWAAAVFSMWVAGLLTWGGTGQRGDAITAVSPSNGGNLGGVWGVPP